MALAHLIARAAPGLGNPLDLTCGEFEEHLRLAANGSDGTADRHDWMRRHVERAR
jgi:hypothetical protein